MVEAKQLYQFTDKAGPWVAGYRRDPAAATISLTPSEAELELLAGTIVPHGTPVPPIVVFGPVSPIDRIAAIRNAKDYDFTVHELIEYLAQGDLMDAFRGAVLGNVGTDRDTLAKLSAALDASAVVLRAMIATRAPSSALADKADRAALDEALATTARIGRRDVADRDASLAASDAYVAMIGLTAARTLTLPAAKDFAPGQPLYIADETGACSADAGLTIAVAARSPDTVAGQPAAVLGSPYQKLAFHSNGSNLWTFA